MADQETSNMTSLERLQNWIDDHHPFKLKNESTPAFLCKPEFTIEDLKEGLIYALTRLRSVDQEYIKLETIAKQYPKKISVKGWIDKYDIEVPKNLCLEEEMESNNYAQEIRNADVIPFKKLTRTIAAIAICVEKIDEGNAELAREIARKGQGDID